MRGEVPQRSKTKKRSSSKSSEKPKIRYAVVGLGYIAQIAVLPAFATAKNSELAALVSDDRVKLEKLSVKELLKELGSTPKDSEQWTAKLTVLKENVEHHVEEEEGEMFKKARKVLTEQEAEDLGARMEAAKNKLSATAR